MTCAAPSLGILKINADPRTGAQELGTYTVSGLRSDSSQGGGNYYNAITITPNVGNESISEIKLLGTAFTSKASPPGDNTLSELMRSSNYNNNTNGFVLIYAVKNTSYPGGPTLGRCGSFNFCAGNYYIYLRNGWYAFSNTDAYGNPSIGIQVVARGSTVSLPNTPPQFSVTLYNALGNHSWGTYSYLNWTGGEQSIPREPVK